MTARQPTKASNNFAYSYQAIDIKCFRKDALVKFHVHWEVMKYVVIHRCTKELQKMTERGSKKNFTRRLCAALNDSNEI